MSAQAGRDDGTLCFHLLGRFEVSRSGRNVPVGGPAVQSVLVALLQRPGRTQLTRQLVSASWGQGDSVTEDTLYHYVSKLRRIPGLAIESCRPGYRLMLPDTAVVDSARFVELVNSADALRRTESGEAITRLRKALDLWRGDAALSGMTLPGIRDIAVHLDTLRLTAAERLAELDQDNVDQVLARCAALARAHPDRGGLVVAVMRAMAAAGRMDDVLELSDRAAQAAIRRGGSVPPAVHHMKEVLLAGGHSAVRAGAALRQVPADTSYFTGRSAELALLGAAREAAVFAVSGMAGIGKTALAVRAAHRIADRFGDGNLFLDLRGFTLGARPIAPGEALAILLHGLGVGGQRIPGSVEARAALFRSELARRSMLVVLDNAHDEAQVRPLLPGAGNCPVIVTSRRRLSGLDSAAHLNLSTLDPGQAARLFQAVAGDRARQFGDSQRAAEAIAGSCGGLPLAIRIAAARLRTSRVLSPAHLLRLLRRDRAEQGLAALDDGERSLASAFQASYDHLDGEQRRAFRLLGRHSGPILGVRGVSALLGAGARETRRLLDSLDQVSMISQFTQDHYRMHDLLRAYAAGLTDRLPDVG